MKTNICEAFGRALVALGEKYPELIVLDADLNTSTKTCYFLEKYPERFVQLGIAEQNMIGVAAGMAIGEGYIAVPATFATFATQRACDQASVSVAYQRANVKIVGTYAGLTSYKGGATHQALEDIAIMRAMPNILVAAPGTPREAFEVMEAAILYNGPVYIRIETSECEDVEKAPFEWGKAISIRNGKELCLVTTGTMLHACIEAAELLLRHGITAGILHCPSLVPFDEEAVRNAAETSHRLVSVENHCISGGTRRRCGAGHTKTAGSAASNWRPQAVWPVGRKPAGAV